ncbi:MAG: biotin transporter BioY [Salaquimonas sp.]|jgi:biotin transport system substrate-specific component|nr:biotin transporter BioY [Salaquimonas sp.]
MTTLAAGNTLAASLASNKPAWRAAWYVFLAIGGTALIALAAKTQVPFWPVPMTLQTLAILAVGAAYGARLGGITLLLYLVEGAAGLPVFVGTPEKGIGLAYMAGPTGGYLVGFVILAAIAGWAADRGWSTNPFKLGAAMLVGEIIMLTMGAAWVGYLFGADKAFAWGFGPFIVTDLVKLAIAAALVPALWMLAPRGQDRGA